MVGNRDVMARFEAMLTDPQARSAAGPVGLVIAGPAGIGKSRIATECLAVASRLGWRTAFIAGNRAAAAIPFAAASGLLRGDVIPRTTDVAQVIARAQRDIVRDGPLCAIVDGFGLLDDASLTLVQHVASAPGVVVVLTARTEGHRIPRLDSMVRSGSIGRVELSPLDAHELCVLAGELLGGVADDDLARWLHESSGGNPLFARELLFTGVDDGSIVRRTDGSLHLERLPRASARLIDIVELRIGELAPEERRCLEAVAAAEPMNLDVIAEMGLASVAADLERRRVLAAHSVFGRVELTAAHPMYAEVARAGTGVLGRRALLRELAEALHACTPRRPGDALRLATWRSESGAPDTAENLVSAAREAAAAGDLDAALRFAAAAHRTEPTDETALVLAEALFRRREPEALERLMRERPATGSRAGIECQLIAARSLFWLLGRFDEADLRLRDAANAAANEAHASLLRRCADELRLCRAAGLAIDDTASLRLRALTLMARGRFAAARAMLDAAADGEEDDIEGLRLFVRDEAGWLSESRARAARTIDPAELDQGGRGWSLVALGDLHLAEGNARAGLATYQRAEESFERADDLLPLPLCATRMALCSLTAGDLDEARRHVERIPEHARHQVFADHVARAEAGVLLASGRYGDAVGVLRRRVDSARARDLLGFELLALGDLIRYGAATQDDRERVIELGRLVDGSTAAFSVRQATAGTDGHQLADLAGDIEAAGHLVWAYEVASDSAAALRDPGDGRARAAEVRRLRRLRANFPIALLRTRYHEDAEEAAEVLRPMDLRVAQLAATGLSDREIAGMLHLSLRTVGNYLQRVYRRLGISGRDQLAIALADAGQPAAVG